MFTPAEYELLRKRSSAELAQFLSAIALPPPTSWEDTAQVKQLDADAARCIAQKLHGKSLLDGCYTLLEDAGLPFDFSETTQTILERIAEHRAEVRAGMTKARPTPTVGVGRTRHSKSFSRYCRLIGGCRRIYGGERQTLCRSVTAASTDVAHPAVCPARCSCPCEV